MEHLVKGCRYCPLYLYEINDWKTKSKCNHPNYPNQKQIDRVYEDGGLYPITPEDCPLNFEDLTMKKQTNE